MGFPRFKNKRHGLGSFRLTGSIHVEGNRIKLPCLGWIRLKEKGYLPTDETPGILVLSATVQERAGRWFVSLQVEMEMVVDPATGNPVGVDLGILALATCSTGEVFENPKALKVYERKLARLQRKLSRQEKGSNRREGTKRRVASLHYRIFCIRRDAIHKANSSLVAKDKPPDKRPSVVVLEDLNISGMMKNRRLARAIADASMSEFKRQLSYKCSWYGSVLMTANRFYPSSKTCSFCGAIKYGLKLSDRTFKCAECRVILDRDLNAAINLLKVAVSSTETLNACGEEVSPAQLSGRISVKREPELVEREV